MRTAALIAALLLPASMATAQSIYRWVDSTGEVHYTDDPDQIPREHRSKSTKAFGAELGVVRSDDPAPPAEAKKDAAAPTREAAPRPQTNASELQWRKAFQDARGRIDSLQRELDETKKKLADPQGAGLPVRRQIDGTVRPSPEYEGLERRVGVLEKELAKAREALDDLDRQAARAAVPLEWRR